MNHNVPANKPTRRKGVTIAAAALSVALVAPFAQSVAYPEITAAAQAQETNSGQKLALELAPKELTKQPPVFYAQEEAKGHLQENGPQYIRTTGILAGTFFPEGTTFQLRDPNWSFEEGASGRGDKPKQDQYKPGNSVGWFGVDRKANPTELDLGPNNLAKTKGSESYNNIPYVVRETGQVLFAFGPNISNKVGSRLYVPMRATYTDPEKKVKYVWDFEQGIQVGDAKTFNRNQPPQDLKNPVAVSVTPTDKLLQFGEVKTGYHLIQERYEKFKRENPNASDEEFKDGRLSRVMNTATAQFRGLYGQKLGEIGTWGSWVDDWRAFQTDDTGEWYEEGEVPKNNLDLAHDDADIYRPAPVSEPLETTVGKVPDAALGIANKGELPESTKFTWEDPSVFASPSEGKNAKLKVTYPDGTSDIVDVPVKVDASSTPLPEAKDLGYTKELGIAAEKDERRDSTGTPNLPDAIGAKEGDFFRFGEDLPTGFVKHPDPDKPNSIIKDGPVGKSTPNDSSDDVVVTINPDTGEITVEAGDKGNTDGPKKIPVEYVGADDTVKGKDSVSVDVKPRPDSDSDEQTPARGLNYPEGGVVVGSEDSGAQRTKESGQPEISASVTKENDDIFRFHKVLPPGFKRVDDDETRVKFDGSNPDDENDDVDLTINRKTGKVTVVGGENAKAKADIPVELIDKDGVPKDSGVISIDVTPETQQTPPPATDDDDTEIAGLGYPGNIFVGPDNYERADSTGIPELSESLKEEGGSFRFGPNLPEGFVNQEPSWPGVEEIVREGDSPSERIVLRINKSNGKVEVQAGDASDYPLSDLPIEYLGANGEVKKEDKITVLVRPTLQAHLFDPEAKTIIVAQGGNPDAAEGIANKGDLPAGTEFEFDGPVDTSAVGEKSAKVVVAYPDGSTETVDVTVNVAAADQDLLSDADRYEPEAKDGVTTSEGETPDAGALIDNKGDLPAGTTFEWEQEPNVSVPGKTTGTVKVNYPDGSSETVDVELEVTEVPTDADGHDPQGRDLDVAEGGELDPADAITNKGDLPAGTEFEFDGPVDTSAVGEKSAKVVVAYPDGSTETVDVTVNVAAADQDLLPDNERYEPQWNDTTIDDSSQTTVENKGDELPHGTEVELGWSHGGLNQGKEDWDVDLEENGDITVTPGSDAQPGDAIAIEVELNYPDGTSETKTIVVQVRGDREEFVPGNFGELPALTGDDNDDLTAGDVFTDAPTVNDVHPGDNIITGTGKPGATITVTGPNGFSTTTTVHENGQWSVDLTGGATPETQFIVSQKDGDKNESDQVLVTVGKDNVIVPTPGAPGSSELPGSSLGSSNFDIPKHLQCAIFAGGATAIPLILLSPMHNMYEMMINPHLNGLREQFHRELHALDQQVRRGLGVEGHPALQFMDHINARVNEFNQQLGQVAHDNRHIGLAAAAIAVAGLSFQHCMNTQAASSSSASSVALASSSQEQAPARNEAKEDNASGIVGWFQGLFNRN